MKNDSPSATAYLIARSTFFLSRDPTLGRFVPKHSAELSEQFVQSRRRFSRWLDRIINSRSFRPLASALERATIPGIKLHYALRKRYLEEVARDALKSGIRQVVVIGAGFDTLALRLHEAFPETEFFEIDHPATQRVKKRAVETHHAPKRNLRFIALDLARTNLEESLLSQAEYSPDEETLFIAEGLLMYLAPEEVSRLFRLVSRSSAASRLAFTFMETQGKGRIGFRKSSCAVDAWLRFRGENFKWGIERARINEFLAAHGFRVLEIASSETLRSRYLKGERFNNLPLADGECICVAEASLKDEALCRC
jgi:methyltransferase (TIGR00027 family)